MKLPPDVEFHEDIRLLVYRPRGLVNREVVNKIISVIGELETTLQEPFNRFSDTVAADAVDLNFEHIIRVSLYRRLFYGNRPPIKSAILATDATLIHYGKVHALLTQGSPINVRVFQDRKEAAKWLGVPIELLVAKASGGSGGQPQKPNMKTKHPRHRLFLLEAISQNCNAVATALCRRAPVGNSIEAPRHSEATTTFMKRVLGAFALSLCVSFAPRAFAVEGGLGRPISGMQIAPFAGVIPPEPGVAVATGETYYEGSIGGVRDVPIAGLLVANVDMKASFTPIALFYIWPTPTKEWNFASAISFPLAWLEVEANLSLGPFSVRKKESTFGLFDLVFTPIVASHHFSQTDHLALSFTFWAPTGSFEKGRLVNLSQNTWTFIPGVAYTKILPEANIELTGIWQMEFDTEDPATRYQNGILSDLEVLAIKRFKNGLGIGFVESWIQQVNDDKGAPAALNGFLGRAFGIGPIVTYSTKLGKSHLDLSARWIHDFDVSNRVEGDGFNFSASLKF